MVAPFWNVGSLSWSRPCSNQVDKIQVFLLSRRGRARVRKQNSGLLCPMPIESSCVNTIIYMIKYMQSNLGLNLNCLSSLPLLSALLNYGMYHVEAKTYIEPVSSNE